jgi:hypothetical protein
MAEYWVIHHTSEIDTFTFVAFYLIVLPPGLAAVFVSPHVN